MQPILMTKFGKGQGNCFQACLASILSCPIKAVPDFMIYGINWYEEFLKWATETGLSTLFFRPKVHSQVIISNCIGIGIWELEGIEERHAVVMEYSIESIENEIVSWKCVELWDPNPNNPTKKALIEHILIWKRV